MNSTKKLFSLLLICFISFSIFSCTDDEGNNNDTPTCSDGILNGDETGIDCGGSCDPCEVAATCTDGIMNGDETGIDCGGSCDPCVTANEGEIVLNFDGSAKTFNSSQITTTYTQGVGLSIQAVKLSVTSGTEIFNMFIPATHLSVGSKVIAANNCTATFATQDDVCGNATGSLIIGAVSSNSISANFNFSCDFSVSGNTANATNGELNNITW